MRSSSLVQQPPTTQEVYGFHQIDAGLKVTYDRCSTMRSLLLFLVLALLLCSESRGYEKQGIGFLDIVDRRREPNVSISNASDGAISNTPMEPIIHAPSQDRHTHALANKHANLGQSLYIHMPLQGRHAVRSLSDSVSLEAKIHISQLAVIAGTPDDTQENVVRRQGVDSALLKYAGLNLSDDPRTGVIFDVALPPTLSGIEAQATRLDPATFKQAGLTFNEFSLPTGASFDPTSVYVVLVYREILNFTVYTLPPQYEFRGPVVGIISTASNFSSLDPSVSASISLSPNTSIKISLPMSSSNSIPNALCAFFAPNGSIFVSSLASSPNICVSSTLGDFALIVQISSTPSPTQNTSPPPPPPPPAVSVSSPLASVNGSSSSSTTSKGTKKNWKLVVGATALALASLAFLVALALISIKLVDRCKFAFTSRSTGNEEALQSSLIGNSNAPTAAALRTKPALEIDMAHFTN